MHLHLFLLCHFAVYSNFSPADSTFLGVGSWESDRVAQNHSIACSKFHNYPLLPLSKPPLHCVNELMKWWKKLIFTKLIHIKL